MATHQKRPKQFKFYVVYLVDVEGQSPKTAFEHACDVYNMTPSGCMTNYPSGYINDYRMEVKATLWDTENTHDDYLQGIVNQLNRYNKPA